MGSVGSTLHPQRRPLVSLSPPDVVHFKVRNQLLGQTIIIWKKCYFKASTTTVSIHHCADHYAD